MPSFIDTASTGTTHSKDDVGPAQILCRGTCYLPPRRQGLEDAGLRLQRRASFSKDTLLHGVQLPPGHRAVGSLRLLLSPRLGMVLRPLERVSLSPLRFHNSAFKRTSVLPDLYPRRPYENSHIRSKAPPCLLKYFSENIKS